MSVRVSRMLLGESLSTTTSEFNTAFAPPGVAEQVRSSSANCRTAHTGQQSAEPAGMEGETDAV